jgi:RHS repeat-associated protein
MGNMTRYGNGEGVTLTQTFDGAAHPTMLTSSLSDAQHPATMATVSHFFPSGAPELLNFGNNLQEIHILNSRLQPCRISVTSNAAYPLTIQLCYDSTSYLTLQDLALQYNEGSTDNGNVVLSVGSYTEVFSRTYSYDSLNRIATMADSTTTGSCKGLGWVYDAWGNRTEQNATAGTCPAPQFTFNANNQIISPAGYTYDASGNMTHDATLGYTYDAENRLTQVSQTSGAVIATYAYDGFGRRIQKVTGGVTTNYFYNVEDQVVAEQTAAGWSAGYVYFDGASLAKYGNGTTYFMHSDHLGSTHLMTTMAAGVYDNYDYLPFGEQIAGGTGTMHKFTGKERDAESNLDDFGARYYGSNMGRFTSADPITIKAARLLDPQRLNLYTYVRNNPLHYVDPDGRDMQLWVVVKDQNARGNVMQAAPKIANDFHRFGVTQVNVHVTSDPSKVVKGSNTVVVTAESNSSMTKNAEFGEHSLFGGTKVNTELAITPQMVRNVTDHETVHDARGDTGIGALLRTDHSSDKNDLMYKEYDPLKSGDPQLSQDSQKELQDRFNKSGDKNEATAVDEDNKKEPEPEKKKEPL